MQWRISVGTFNAISAYNKKFRRIWKESLIDFSPFTFMPLLFLLRLPFGLLTDFWYSFMIVPLSFLLYPYTQFYDDTPTVDYSMTRYFAHATSNISTLPSFMFIFLKTLHSVLKSLFSEEAKNMCFFCLVLQILLVISGSVEVNPGPTNPKLKNLSFAVFNLDSLPAREFTRIPLIESFQSTYDFDIF